MTKSPEVQGRTGMVKYIGIFAASVWADWLARISGGLAVPFTILSLFPFSPSTKILFGALAVFGLIVTVFRLWVKEYQASHREALRFILHPDYSRFGEIRVEGPGLCRFNGSVAVMFENSDTAPLYIRLHLSIRKRLTFRRQQEVVPPQPAVVAWEIGSGNLQESALVRGISIPGRHNSQPYLFGFIFELPEGIAFELSESHFLRITMKATNQSPLFLDADVDWNAARRDYEFSRLKYQNATTLPS